MFIYDYLNELNDNKELAISPESYVCLACGR